MGTPKFRWGRLKLSSASGPETQPLKIPVLTEYWNGSRFVTNTADSGGGCTVVPKSAIKFNEAALTSDSRRTVNLSFGGSALAAETTGDSTNGNGSLASNDLQLDSGDGNLIFSAPTPADSGTFTVEIDLSSDLEWLRYDWDLDGSHDDSPPKVQGSFGTFGGHDKVLFRREL